ncbi:MAG: OsmC family protein [Candidatus Melainabacteria bacterium]
MSPVLDKPRETFDLSEFSHAITTDTPVIKGTGADPKELVYGALGVCTNMTILKYATRKGWQVDEVTVNIREEKDAQTGLPRIEKTISLRGELTENQLNQLKTAAEKCPVNKLIMGEKLMESSIRIKSGL